MSIILNVTHSQLNDENLQNLTQELCQMIEDETDIKPSLAVTEGKQGTKAADIITLGEIVLAFFSSGTAVALCGVLKAYFNRHPSIKFSFKDVNGSEVKIDAQNIDLIEIQQLLAKLQSDDE